MDRSVQIQKTVRELDAIEKFLKCNGISEPPDTPSGRALRKARDELIAISQNSKLSNLTKSLLAENCLSAILICRAAMTTVIQCRRPIPSAKMNNQLRMSALKQASDMFFKAEKTVRDILKELDAEPTKEDSPSIDKILNELRMQNKPRDSATIEPEWEESE